MSLVAFSTGAMFPTSLFGLLDELCGSRRELRSHQLPPRRHPRPVEPAKPFIPDLRPEEDLERWDGLS